MTMVTQRRGSEMPTSQTVAFFYLAPSGFNVHVLSPLLYDFHIILLSSVYLSLGVYPSRETTKIST